MRAPARETQRSVDQDPIALSGELLEIVGAASQLAQAILPAKPADGTRTTNGAPRRNGTRATGRSQPRLAGLPVDRHASSSGTFLDALQVAVYTTDASGRITFFNDAAAAFWGRRPKLGELWCGSWRLYTADRRPIRHDECPMAICLVENRPIHGGEAIAERPDGTFVSFMAYPTPLRNETGQLIGAVNVLVDVSGRRRVEDELRATAAALRTSNAVKDEFLGLISHELRTPVTTIFGNATLLEQHADRLTEDVKRSMIADIADDSARLRGIIENLLLLTRLESGADLDREPQVLTHAVRRAVEAFRRRHPGRTVNLECDVAPVIVEADAMGLELLLDNLLGNAHKYSPFDAPIDVAVAAGRREASVVVRDRGIGLGSDDAERIFLPFVRTDAAKVTANGIGIGLAVCRRIVETQDGRIWAVARDGGGPEFGFALPVPHQGDLAA